MNSKMFYKALAGIYDLLDVIYFRVEANSPRKSVLEKIKKREKVLDLCTGTATNALSIAKRRPDTKVVGIDLSKDMLRVAKDKLRQSGLKNVRLYQLSLLNLTQIKEHLNSILPDVVIRKFHSKNDKSNGSFDPNFGILECYEGTLYNINNESLITNIIEEEDKDCKYSMPLII